MHFAINSMPDWLKTLTIALVTSFVTVCLLEPIKTIIQRWLQRREMRRSLYHEMALNFRALDGQVILAVGDPEMIPGMSERFGRGFKKFSYDLAQRDPVNYYGLGFNERYWIETLYSDMEHIKKGHFENNEVRLRAARFTAGQLITYVKNRYISRRLLFRVCPVSLRNYIRELLPEANYVDVHPPSLVEKMRRRLD